VLGRLASAAGAVEAPIGRSRHDPTRRAVVADGKPARTDYRLERSFDEPEPLSVLTCHLHTGRTHQIRVHLQAIGHPVVADARYGGGRLTLGLDRPFLHAAELAFDHPHSGEPLAFRSPLPADLVAVLDGLEAAAG
jgi:23S rRNA pseudouridine1911/1915/1917 synthase